MEMFKRSLISKSDMEAVESSFQEANLKYKIAMDRLELLEKGRISMSNREINSLIKSPANGIILSQSVFQGDPVVPLTNYQPGTELCSLADMGSLRFKGTVDEIDVGKIICRNGCRDPDRGPARNEDRRTGRPDLSRRPRKKATPRSSTSKSPSVNPAGTTLRAGFSATASIRIRDRKQVLMLPERLVLFENGKRFVEVPGRPGRARPRKSRSRPACPTG